MALKASVFAAFLALCSAGTYAQGAETTTVLALGDSITQGGKKFVCYRQVLIPELRKRGLAFKFIGPNTDATSAHAGYSGKDTKYLLGISKKLYKQYPADIVMLHSGHNSFSKDKPVAGIVKDTEGIIENIRAENPKAIILLAQAITAGKLPKYSYIPALNKELAALAKRLKDKQYNVVLVNQADGFDWKTDTIKDKVHPNAAGAKKMADKWLAALLATTPGSTGKVKKHDFSDFNQKGWIINPKSTQLVERKDRDGKAYRVLRIAKTKMQLAYVRNFAFEDGAIDCDMRGGAYLGIAFRLRGGDKGEIIYFRPPRVPGWRNTIQYIAKGMKNYDTWEWLRKTYPGVYESKLVPIPGNRPGKHWWKDPDPFSDKWFHVKITVLGKKAEVYVDGQKKPAFVVNELKYAPQPGTVGLYAWRGEFKNLKVQVKK